MSEEDEVSQHLASDVIKAKSGLPNESGRTHCSRKAHHGKMLKCRGDLTGLRAWSVHLQGKPRDEEE